MVKLEEEEQGWRREKKNRQGRQGRLGRAGVGKTDGTDRQAVGMFCLPGPSLPGSLCLSLSKPATACRACVF